MQARRDGESLAIRDNRPSQFILTEIGWDLHSEHSPLAAGQEVGWLTLIRASRIDPVIRSDGDIDFLLCIAIEIAQKQAEASVGVFEPAFEGTGDAGAGFVDGFQGQCLRVETAEGRHRYEEPAAEN